MPLNIDWQQILLHLLNFVILAGGLYFLLYKPVKEFIAKREEYYAGRALDAERACADADALKAEYQKKLDEAESEIVRRRKEAEGEIEEERRTCIEGAQQEAKAILSKAQKAAEAKSRKALAESNKQIRDFALAAVEKLAFSSDTEALDAFLNEAESERSHG